MAGEMTFDEALTGDKPALWRGAEDEFMLNPASGIVWWRSLYPEQAQHGGSWRPVPWRKTIPSEGWRHEIGCRRRFRE